MKRVQGALVCSLLAALVSLVVMACLLVRSSERVIAGLPGQLDASRDELLAEVAAARIDAFAEIGTARAEFLLKADTQLNALRSDVMGQVAATREVADRRLGDSLARVDSAIAEVELARRDVAPVVTAATGLVKDADAAVVQATAVEKDAQDSWDTMYDDVNAAVQSSNVVLTQIGQAALESREAAVANTKHVAGITADIHTITTAATKPKSFLGKVWEAITVASRLAGLL